MSLVCEESHLCFGKEPEPAHKTSHLCFGRRYRPNLDSLEIIAVASVLEDAVHQLAILGETLPVDPKVDLNEGFKNVESRFGKPPPSPRKYPQMAGHWPPATEALLKVQHDRQFAESVLDSVLNELRTRGSFGTLKASLDWQGAMVADELSVLARYEEGRVKQEQLAVQLRSEKRHMLDQRSFWEKKAELLTSNLHDAYLLGGLAISHADAWERNRREQQGLVFGRKEDALREAVERIQDPDGPDEERVHADIMRFLARDTEILKRQLDHWTDLYDAEMMQHETENIQLRNILEVKKDEHIKLGREAQRRKKIIEDAGILRAEYEKKQEIISHVVAIQAWWRGVSFRAGLSGGKGKKDKKRKKGKKKSEKKKKLKKK